MNFPESLIADIKQRTVPSRIVGRKVALQSKGHGEFSGLCPFHKEKTPSFTVSDQKGFYYCFGCGAKGDVFKFLAEIEGLKFNEAVEFLAKEAGLALPDSGRAQSPEDHARYEKRKQLMVVAEQACEFFSKQLHSPVGKAAKAYLIQRGFSEEVMRTFRLGYAPEQWHTLHHALMQQGVSEQQMLDAGLLSKNERGEMYDRFRGRIMFPIMDAIGKVVAFGGRVQDKQEPKYLNSPETELFKKGHLLYNYHLAKKYAMQAGAVVVTEGYVDTIALSKAGIPYTVASLGTAITKEQLQLLWKLSKKPIICLDGDAAGIRAMERVAHLAMPLLTPGHTLMFAQVPSPHDPDDVIRKQGVEAMHQILAQARSLSEVIWSGELSKQDVTIPEHKAELEHRLMQMAGQIEDKSVSAHYRSFFNTQLWQLSARKKQVNAFLGKTLVSEEEPIDLNTIYGCEFVLTSMIASFPELLKIPSVYEEWLNIEFSSNKLDNLRSIILQMADSRDKLCKQDIETALYDVGCPQDMISFKALKDKGESLVSCSPDAVFGNWSYMLDRYHLVVLKTEYTQMLAQMTEEGLQRAYGLKQQIDQLEVKLNQAELAFGDPK